MIKQFLNQTDNFLYSRVKNIFEKAESACKNKQFNLATELQHLKNDPIISNLRYSTKFEKNVKFKLKIMLGIFFVAVPLFSFLIVSNYYNVHFSYAFLSTLVVTLLATSRMDEIVSMYAKNRSLNAYINIT